MKLVKGNVRKLMAVIMAAAIMLSLTALFVSADYDNEYDAAYLYESDAATESALSVDPVSSNEPTSTGDLGYCEVPNACGNCFNEDLLNDELERDEYDDEKPELEIMASGLLLPLGNNSYLGPFAVGAPPYQGGSLEWGSSATVRICTDGCSVPGLCFLCDNPEWGSITCSQGHYGRSTNVYLGGTATGPVTWDIVCHGVFPRDEFEISFNPALDPDDLDYLEISVIDGMRICRNRTIELEVTRDGYTATVNIILRACCISCESFCLSCEGCFHCVVDQCPSGSGLCEKCCILSQQCFTVTFDLAGGTRTGGGDLVQRHLSHGVDATAPTVDTREGYIFDGWDRSYTNVTYSFTVTALWTAIFHGVEFVLDGGTQTCDVDLMQQVRHGQDATAPNVTRAGYNFTGWDIAFDNVTESLTVTAQWALIITPPVPPTPPVVPPVPPSPPVVPPVPPTPPVVPPVTPASPEDEAIDPPVIIDPVADTQVVNPPAVTQPQLPTLDEVAVVVEPQAIPYAPSTWIDDGSIPRVAFGGRDILLFSPFGENSWSLVSLILTVLGAVLGVLTAIRFVQKKKEERYDDFDTYYDDMEEKTKRNRTLFFIATIVTAIIGIMVFLIFNDIRTPLVLVNIWTILNAIIFALEAVAIKLMHKRPKGDIEEHEQAATA